MRVLQQKSSNTTTARLCSHVDSSDAATKWLLKKEHGINYKASIYKKNTIYYSMEHNTPSQKH